MQPSPDPRHPMRLVSAVRRAHFRLERLPQHRALGYRTPAQFLATWRATHLKEQEV